MDVNNFKYSHPFTSASDTLKLFIKMHSDGWIDWIFDINSSYN